VTKKREQSMMK
jgi:hypothetical protein